MPTKLFCKLSVFIRESLKINGCLMERSRVESKFLCCLLVSRQLLRLSPRVKPAIVMYLDNFCKEYYHQHHRDTNLP